MSEHVARFVHGELERRPGVGTELLDIREIPMPVDDAGETIKDARFAASMNRADGLVIVAPEYNHSFPGLLKHVLDSCLEEYIHKPAGIAAVSAGPFGGARGIQSLLPVLRELGLVGIFWDLNFGAVSDTFDASGRLLDEAYVRRADKFLAELVWMAKTLRHGRENIALE
jgi:NAD(P)H-dependent FMN reductase